MGLTRDHQQGDGGRFDDGMHDKILAVTRRLNRSYEWRQDFIWYDQQGNGHGGSQDKTRFNAGEKHSNSLIKKEK